MFDFDVFAAVNSWAPTWFLSDLQIINDPYYNTVEVSATDPLKHSFYNTSTSFAFENEWNAGSKWSYWSRTYMHIPFICVFLYLVLIFGLKSWMDTRTKFDIRFYWLLWNSALALFSWCGAIRMVPHLFTLGYHHGLFATYCGNPVLTYGGHGTSGLFTALFIFSKVPELMDTVFIVLSKSKLHFLQWYHHVTVLLYTWHSYATRSGAGVWFITMNYSVHAVMYLYFALMNVASARKEKAAALKNDKDRKKALADVVTFKKSIQMFAPLVTLMQLSQMFAGIAIMALVFRDSELFRGDQKCYVRRSSWFAGLLMYASYFALFAVFGVNKYCLSGGGSKKTQKRNAPAVESAAPSKHAMSTRSRSSASNAKDKRS